MIITTILHLFILYRCCKVIKTPGRGVHRQDHHLLRLLRPWFPDQIRLRIRGYRLPHQCRTLTSTNHRSQMLTTVNRYTRRNCIFLDRQMGPVQVRVKETPFGLGSKSRGDFEILNCKDLALFVVTLSN